jgi:hypothetical protein
MVWPENFAVSVLVVTVIAMAFLYAARAPMHALIRSMGHAVGGPLRVGARWLATAVAEMQQRNKAVLLAQGRKQTGKRIEREFERLGALVTRELQGYPAMQRKLLEDITRIEDDYRKCGEVPPTPPDWAEAVSAMAKVQAVGSEVIIGVLEELNRSMNAAHSKAMGEYRKAYESRHKILDGVMPLWRSVDKNLHLVEKNVADVKNSVKGVDNHMAKYEQIVAGTDKAQHALSVSAFTEFAISLLVMLVAAGGAFINCKLIALPMSEMVGAGDYITRTLRTSDVAALVIICIEASMGLFLMEAMRITHLFQSIANLSERTRKRMMWIALTLLVVLAGVEAALALMRDLLIADKQALIQSLATVQTQSATDGWVGTIPTAGQMLLGFILPFALAFIAIPLESLIHSSRTVGGVLLMALVRLVALALRTAANLVRNVSRLTVHLYDVAIAVPLLIERMVKARAGFGGSGNARQVERTQA